MGNKLTLYTLAALAMTIPLANAASFQERALASGGSGRIYGGTEAPSGSADWAVSLRRDGSSYCGGTLVHPVTKPDKENIDRILQWGSGEEKARWVVTAAHCLYARGGRPLEPEEIKARSGVVKLAQDKSEPDRSVIAIIEHPGYNPQTLENDIALLYLEPTTKVMNKRGSVGLPSDGDASWVNANYLQTYALGWGLTETSSDPVNDLRQVRVPLMDNAYCRAKYREAGSDILPGMICAGFALGEFDSCQGDSGGPLVHRTRDSIANKDSTATLIGVVSWGIGCALPSLPGVYTSVQYFKLWMESAVEQCLVKPVESQCTSRATGYRDDKSSGRIFTRMISGDIVLFPEGCEKNDAIICRLGEPIRFEQKPNLVWESDVWTSDKVQSGTTDGASIPKWAQPVIGGAFDRSYLKAAIIHDHYCYEENHVRTWQQVHRMFYDALIDSGISHLKARTMYYAVLLGGPRWKDLVPGEYCGVGCIKTRMENAGFPSDGEWEPALYEKNGFAEAVSDLQTEQETTGMLDLDEIERRAALDRKTLVE